MLTEYHTHEMVAHSKRKLGNALKFGTSGKVHSKEGVAPVEVLLLAPPNYSEVGAPRGELNKAVGEALVQ